MSDPIPAPFTAVPETVAPPVQREVRLRHLATLVLTCFFVKISIVAEWVLILVVRAVIRHEDAGKPTPGPRLLLLLTAIDFSLAIFGSWYFACHRTGRSFRDGLRAFAPSRRVALISLGLGAVCVGAKHLFLAIDPSGPPEMLKGLLSTRAGFLSFVALGLLSPFFEEIYYRGFMFLAIENRFGKRWATAFVTIWFLALHVPQYWPSAGAIASILALSFTVTMLRARTGSFIPSMIAHAIYNWSILAIALVMRDAG